MERERKRYPGMRSFDVTVYVDFGMIGTPAYSYTVRAFTPDGAKAAALDLAGQEYPGRSLDAVVDQPDDEACFQDYRR